MKIGFIGTGNMASAIITGMIKSGKYEVNDIIAFDLDTKKLNELSEKYGIKKAKNNVEVAELSDVLILAVKPIFYSSVIDEIKDKGNAIVVSLTPGLSIKYLESLFDREVKIVRTMPNTPALVGEGMTAYCKGTNVSDEEVAVVVELFEGVGKCSFVEERLMDAVVGISGSSPAYVYIFIEAMADAAVKRGMPRDKAYEFAAQAVLGSAKTVLETGIHPGALKDMVCSPGGTTIAAVAELENSGFRSSVIKAVEACIDKSESMGK